MDHRSDQENSLTRHVQFYWLISGVVSLVASILAVVVLGWIDYRNDWMRSKDDLIDKSLVVARRLAGELLVDRAVVPVSVMNLLKQELTLENISIEHGAPPCLEEERSGVDLCWKKGNQQIWIYRKIPYLKEPETVLIVGRAPKLMDVLNLGIFWWSGIPIVTLLTIGLVLQKRYLKSHVVQPIEALVNTTLETNEPPAHWPSEIRNIAKRLSRSFDQRDQFILDQIVAGVIHDIRTLIHPVMSATELVVEQEVGTSKRLTRLEFLAKASKVNLTKVKQLIDLTLDSTREIKLNSRNADLKETVIFAISAVQDLAQKRKVNVNFQEMEGSVLLNYDPVQLERVFLNLIKNAIEAFQPVSTEMEISAERTVRIRIAKHVSPVISILFEDSGPGISENMGNLFKPFRSRKSNGVGLGLVISKKIVESHGGKIQVSQSPDLFGASFEVILPNQECGECIEVKEGRANGPEPSIVSRG